MDVTMKVLFDMNIWYVYRYAFMSRAFIYDKYFARCM